MATKISAERAKRRRGRPANVNTYAATCWRCGVTVYPHEGYFERNPRTHEWRTQHAECAIAYRGTEISSKRPRTRRRAEKLYEERNVDPNAPQRTLEL